MSDSKLIVIDMQRIFRDSESQWCCPEYDPASQRVVELTEAFPGRVIWTRFVRDPEEPGAWSDYYDRWDRCREPETSRAWELTLPVGKHDPVLTAPTFGKWGSELAQHTDDADHLIVCGVATDCCVLSTVLGAVDAGKRITVVADACAGVTGQAHEHALSLMGLLDPMVRIATTDEVLAAR